jgi:hypothetical protein
VVFEGVQPCLSDLLEDAYKQKVDLSGCFLPRDVGHISAKLPRISLVGADLNGNSFRSADLNGANFRMADMSHCVFIDTDLRGAYFNGAYLNGARFVRCQLDPMFEARLSILPDGDIVGWKKCRDEVVVKLLIPAAFRRSNGTGRKCRAEGAKVLEIFPEGAEAVSLFDSNTVYRVGETVRCYRAFDEDRYQECSAGIHFFLTRAEAENFSI